MGQGGERTEKATAKKRRDARKRGQVRRSNEVNIAFCSIVMFGLLFALWPWLTGQMTALFSEYLSPASIMMASRGMNHDEIMSLLARVLIGFFVILLPIFGAAIVAGIAANVLQIGFMFTTDTLKVRLNKINPVNGFKQMFSAQRFVDLIKNLLKVALIGFVAYVEYMALLDQFGSYVGQNVYISFIEMMRTAFMVALRMCLVMVFIAIADFLYQWWKYEKDLRMTKQEVKDEFKMMEGDPQIKSKIRQRQMQMSAMRMMSRVPEADVVITNPTHFAVALAYKADEQKAPSVLAKGQDYVAHKIREVAIEHGIQIVENPVLAQSLFATCEINDEIPEDLYQEVADILVSVYRQSGKLPR
ncbi:MAG: flagellar biosynthesis protein FlhB [Oscillospiraceae bacterium]|nr:flagellar biosynthesis protein FlhB [Oscillospiraceae bacterium]